MNLAGAAIFTLYGVLVEAWPVALVNGFISFVNIWNLMQLKQEKPNVFELISFDVQHPFVERFLKHYEQDMSTVFPSGKAVSIADLPDEAHCDVVYRNMVPSGLCVHREVSPTEQEIYLDYVMPEHRDYKTSEFLYTALRKRFGDSDVQRLRIRPSQVYDTDHLQKLGFQSGSGEDDAFFLQIESVSPAG